MPKAICILTLAGLAFASTSVAQDRFDLVCRIDVIGTSPTPAFRRSGRENLRIRVDKANLRFCIDDCNTIEELTVSSGAIRGTSGDVRFQVHQRSGDVELIREGLFSGLGRGVCDTASFTGFPRRGFGDAAPTVARSPSPSQAAPQTARSSARSAEVEGPRPYASLPGTSMSTEPPRLPVLRSVQIGAYSSVEIARAELAKVATDFSGYVGGTETRMQAVTALNGHTVIRTSFIDMSPSDADSLCAAMRRAGRDCIVR